jgi:hypothetical protein
MRFVAPIAADIHAPNDHWVTGGRYVWETRKGWDTHCSAHACDRRIVHDLGAESSMAGLAVSGHTIYTGYCGGDCDPAGDFYAGLDTNYGHWLRYGHGLPNAVPVDLTTTPDGTEIVVSTHGRGMWQISAP